MKFKSIKNVMAGITASLMFATFVPTTVLANEDPLSKESLKGIVSQEVGKLDFDNLGIDSVINGINNTVTNTVTGMVNEVITPDNIKTIITPIIQGLVKTAIGNTTLPAGIDVDKIISDIINSDIVDKILTSDLTNEIIERTVEYAVADIMDIVKLPTAGDVIETSKEELINKTVNEAWSATKVINIGIKKFTVNPYHDLKITLSPISVTPTGWNSTSIAVKLNIDLVALVTGNIKAPNFEEIPVEDIVMKAAQRAVKDIVNEKIAEIKVKINTAVQGKLDEISAQIKIEAEKAAKDLLNKLNSIFKR